MQGAPLLCVTCQQTSKVSHQEKKGMVFYITGILKPHNTFLPFSPIILVQQFCNSINSQDNICLFYYLHLPVVKGGKRKPKTTFFYMERRHQHALLHLQFNDAFGAKITESIHGNL